MKIVFDFLLGIFAVYCAIHAIVWATGIVFGLGPAIWLLIFCIPVFLSNGFIFGACARGDFRRESTMQRRRQWRGY